MRIGVDIDGTLTNINDWMIERAITFAKENNINLTVNDACYHYSDMFDWTDDDLQKYLERYFIEYLSDIKPEVDSVEILNRLQDEGHEVVFVTARGTFPPELEVINYEETNKMTVEWLDKNNYHYDKIISNARDKVKTLEDEKLDMFIDDVDTNVYALSKYVPVIVPSRKYNTSIEGDNITKANSWNEIYKIIKSM